MNRLPRALNQTRFAIKVAALVACTAVVGAQTRITPPKNKYTPQQDVEIGREAAAEVRREYPIIDDRQIDSYLDGLGRRLVAAAPAELKQEDSSIVHAGEPEGHQRLRASRRADVRQSRDVRRGEARRRSRGRHGARAQPRAAAARHSERDEGTGFSSARSPAPSPARSSAAAGQVISQGTSSVSAPGCSSTAASTRSRPTCWVRRSWRARDTTLATWAACSRRLRSREAAAPPQWLSSHPNPGNRTQYIADEAEQAADRPAPQPGWLRAGEEPLRHLAAREVDG